MGWAGNHYRWEGKRCFSESLNTPSVLEGGSGGRGAGDSLQTQSLQAKLGTKWFMNM